MMLPLSLILLIVIAHYVADWLCQTREMAEGKSSSWYWLNLHGGVYTCALLIAIETQVSYDKALPWAFLNGAAHWITDALTSRLNAWSWKTGHKGGFWNGVGGDQCLHYLTLFATAAWLLS